MFNFGVKCAVCGRAEVTPEFVKDARTGEPLYWSEGPPRAFFCTPTCALTHAQRTGMVSARGIDIPAFNGEKPLGAS